MKGFSILGCIAYMILLIGCAGKEKALIGKWIGINKNAGSLEFKTEGKVLWNGLSERSYEIVDEKTLEFSWLNLHEKYIFDVKGDTLELTGADVRLKYMRLEKVQNSPEPVKALLLKKVEEQSKKKVSAIKMEVAKVAELKKLDFENHAFLSTLDENTPVYTARVHFVSKQWIDVIVQPTVSNANFGITWEETKASIFGRYISELFSMQCKSVSFKKYKDGFFKGPITLENGDTFELLYGEKVGIRPYMDNITDLQLYYKHIASRKFGKDVVKEVRLKPEGKDSPTIFIGEMVMANGELLPIGADAFLGGWLLRDPQEKDVLVSAKYRSALLFGMQLEPALIKKKSENEYEISLSDPSRNIRMSGLYQSIKLDFCPNNTLTDLSLAVQLQLSRSLMSSKIVNVELKSTSPTTYTGFVVFDVGDKKGINVTHEGTSFKWELHKKPNKKQQMEQFKKNMSK